MPQLGDKAVCRMCKTPIVWSGRYWEHTDISPRHIAVPEDAAEATKTPVISLVSLEARVAELEAQVASINRIMRARGI